MNVADTAGTARYATSAPPPLHSASLRERYEAYCRAQGRELLNLVPREGVRSLLRVLRDLDGAPTEEEIGSEETLDRLGELCRRLLPLPPFEVWTEDFHRARSAYAELPGPPLAPQAVDGSPVTVDVRAVTHRGEPWVADLALRPLEARWVGQVRFHREGEPSFVQTGEILREDSPLEVRARFRDFDETTLVALLRSVLP
jgi:hypothetical protein